MFSGSPYSRPLSSAPFSRVYEPPPSATFVQLDNWLNGNWIGQYGGIGYSLFNVTVSSVAIPDNLPAQISYGIGGSYGFVNPFGATPGPGLPAKYLQIPGQPGVRGLATYYTSTAEAIYVINDTGNPYAITLVFADPDPLGRTCNVIAYNVTSNIPVQLDAARASGSLSPNDVYMTWNVQGCQRVQFNINFVAGSNITLVGWFLDRFITVNGRTHNTNTWIVSPVTKTHGTDVFLTPHGVGKTHGTDTYRVDTRVIAWWQLDETATGAPAVDSGPYAANLTDWSGTTTASTTAPIAAPTKFTPANPRGRLFPVSKSFLYTGVAQPSQSIGSNFTVSAWVRLNASGNMPIVTHQLSNLTQGWGLMTDANSKVIYTAPSGGVTNTLTSEFILSTNVWTHVAIVTTTNTRLIYVKGIASAFSSSIMPVAGTTSGTCLGHDYFDTSTSTPCLNGDLDDVRIYNGALNADQINTLAYGMHPFPPTVTTRSHGTNCFVGQDTLSYWPLDETGTGQIAVDATGLANGTDVAGTTTAATTVPVAAPVLYSNPHSRHFPGDTYLNCGAHTQHAIAGNFTLSAWIRLTANTTFYGIITRLTGTAPAAGWGFLVMAPPNQGYLGFLPYGGGNSSSVLSNGPVPLNVWTHVAAVQRAGVRYVYVNGIRQAGSDSFAWTMPATTTNTIISGWASDGPTAYPWVGDLDDIRFYGTALTDDQINSLAYGNPSPQFIVVATRSHGTDTTLRAPITKTHGTSTVALGNLVSWWKLDETGTGALAIDSAPTAANATDTNGLTTVSTPAPTVFANPNARRFSGTNASEVLTAGVQVEHALTNNFTVSAWIRPTANPNPAMGIVACLDSRTPTAGGATGGGWSLTAQNSSTAIILQTSNGTNLSNQAGSGPMPPLNVWTHVTGLVRAGVGAIYVNGYQQGYTGNQPIGIPPTAMPTNVGNYPSQGLGYPWFGDLDDVRIYRIALTDDQIASLGYGNEPFLVTPATRAHGTDTKLVASATKTHSTDVFVASRLISYWKLNEIGTGQVAIDAMGLANATDVLGITTNSATAPVHAPTNYPNPTGRYFTGGSNSGTSGDGPYLDAGVVPAHGPTANFTVAAWVRPGRLSSQEIVTHAIYPLNRGWLMNTDSNGVLNFGCYNGAAITTITAYDLPPIAVGSWTHVAITCSSTLRCMYVAWAKSTYTSAGMPAASPDLHTYLGRDFNGPSSWDFNGDLDEIRFYNFALSDDQVQSLAGGNDPLVVTPTIKTHTTDSVRRSTTTTSHGTDSDTFRLVLTWTKTHFVDVLPRATSIRAHSTDYSLVLTTAKTHGTNVLPLLTSTKAHGTNVLPRATTAKIHGTDILLRATTARMHATDVFKPTPVTKTHSTGTLPLLTSTKAHGTNVLPRATTTRIHGTDTSPRTTTVRTHSTGTLPLLTSTKAHGTNVLSLLPSTKAHGTDTSLRATTIRTHATDIFKPTPATRVHGTDSIKPATSTKTHNTGTLPLATSTKVHSTNTLTPTTSTKFHGTNTLLRATSVRTHASDVLLRTSSAVVQTTNTSLRVTTTRAHATDVTPRATTTRAHATDSTPRITTTRAHSTSTFMPATRTLTYQTDSFVSLGIMASRSRSQRVGTRAIAFNEG